MFSIGATFHISSASTTTCLPRHLSKRFATVSFERVSLVYAFTSFRLKAGY
jgi:hypothetical protein